VLPTQGRARRDRSTNLNQLLVDVFVAEKLNNGFSAADYFVTFRIAKHASKHNPSIVVQYLIKHIIVAARHSKKRF